MMTLRMFGRAVAFLVISVGFLQTAGALPTNDAGKQAPKLLLAEGHEQL